MKKNIITDEELKKDGWIKDDKTYTVNLRPLDIGDFIQLKPLTSFIVNNQDIYSGENLTMTTVFTYKNFFKQSESFVNPFTKKLERNKLMKEFEKYLYKNNFNLVFDKEELIDAAKEYYDYKKEKPNKFKYNW